MLLRDQLDFDFVGCHWYSEMGDIDAAGGHNVWAKLASFGKPIWVTELDRRGGSSTRPIKTDPAAVQNLTQSAYLAHEIERLINLTAATVNSPLRAIMVYELYDEPHQGNGFPKTCETGNTSTNGESYYGMLSTSWIPGPRCDQYPSCGFAAKTRKPAWSVLRQWARKLDQAGPRFAASHP